MIAQWLTKYTLKTGKIHFFLRSFIYLMAFFRNILAWKRGNFSSFENAEKNADFFIEKNAFLSQNRHEGISAFARLKNAEEFLQKVVESYIDVYDEIVLVDNNSTDSTPIICEQLAQKYPEKIKFFRYTPEVYGLGHAKYAETPEDSIHSLAFYYNWTLSKTTKKLVAKLDDDVIVADRKLFGQAVQKIKKSPQNGGIIFPQLNIVQKNNAIVTPLCGVSRFLPLIAGIYCDHGIFPVSPKSYFIKGKNMERFIFPFAMRFADVSLFHLKGLKKDLGGGNQHGDMKKLLHKTHDVSEYASLPPRYQKMLSDLEIL